MSSCARTLNEKLAAVSQLKLSYMDLPAAASANDSEMGYGHWLSRNLIAHCRLSQHLLGHLRSCKQSDGGRHRPPEHDCYTMYSRKDIVAWCSERQIPVPAAVTETEHEARMWFLDLVASPEKCFGHYDDDCIVEHITHDDAFSDLRALLSLTAREMRSRFYQHVEEKN